MKRLLFLLPLLVLLLVWAGYNRLTSTNRELGRAKQALLEGECSLCDSKLSSLHPNRLEFPYCLYQGYRLLIEGAYGEAKELFEMAKEKGSSFPLLELESALASSLCSYHQNEFEEANKALLPLYKEFHENSWYKFIEGFTAYQNEEYKRAIHCWNEIDYHYLEEEALATNWAASLFKKLLSEETYSLQLARSFIEEQEFVFARELLEKTQTCSIKAACQNLASLYLGYSYLKEAEHKSLSKQLTYYKLASFYFERTSIASLEEKEINLIALSLFERAKELIHKDAFGDEPFVYLILPLQKWSCVSQLEQLSDLMVERLIEIPSRQELTLASILQAHLEGSLFHTMVTEKLTQIILKKINSGQISYLSIYCELIQKLLPNNRLFTEKCRQQIIAYLDCAIMQDDENLTQLLLYIDLLESMGQKDAHLATRLLAQAKVLWQENGEEKKATKLMQIALAKNPDKNSTKEAIEHYLTALFDQAESCNLIERLTHIYDALVAFDIKTKSLMDPSVLANHLADAEYRYKTGQFSSSKTVSAWVLKLDPRNQEAMRLLGLNYYHLGDYHEAICTLNKVHYLDEDAHKALALSEVFSSSEQSHLVQIDNLDNYEEDK